MRLLPTRAITKVAAWLASDRKTSVSSRAPAIVNRNMAGPTLVMPVCAPPSAATAGKADRGVLVSRVRPGLNISLTLRLCAADAWKQVTFLRPDPGMPDSNLRFL